MKLPEKPINWKEVLQTEGNEVSKLINDKALFKQITEFNRRYLYWDELRYRVSKGQQKHVWTLMKLLRSEQYEKISYGPMNIKLVNLSSINKYLHRFDKFLAGNIEIQTKTLGLEKKYIVSSLMEEAIASSMIEGAVTTRKIAKEMLRQKRKPKNQNEQMVINGYETMRTIVKRKNDLLTPEFLLETQSMITKETLLNEGDVGMFRGNNDIVVGDTTDIEKIYHVPPEYQKIPHLIDELCNFANKEDEDFIHPIIKGIILHFLIGYIHPFNDGNGRTARSVFYWYMLSKGYWLFEYMAVSRAILRSKKNYGLAYLYTESDEFDVTYFIRYNVEAIEESLKNLLDYIKLKQSEQQEAQRVVEKIEGLNYRQANLLEEIMKNKDKAFSIQEISQTYNVVYQTARTDLLLLARLGHISMQKISKKFLFKSKPSDP